MKLGTLLRRARRTSRGPRMAAALAIAALGLWAADAISGPWFAGTRYRVHVATDKPVYRLGEMVYVRGVVLDALSRTPMQHQTAAQLRVTGPGGKAIASYWMQTADSVAAAAWQIPAHLPGGEYTVAVSMPHSGIPAAKRTFEVRAFRAPRLKHQLEFLRKGLGPGDTAIASLQVERAEGGIPAGAAVTIVATVDG